MSTLSTERLQAVRDAWPGITLDDDRFRTEWQRLDDGTGEVLDRHAADLYLAVACIHRDPVALMALRAMIEEQLQAFDNFRLSRDDKGELSARALAVLVVGGPTQRPKLTQYAARGPLGGWLRIVVGRLLVDDHRAKKRHLELDDETLLGSATPASDPELELLKERFRGQFSSAFREAIGLLGVRERNLLRQFYLDDLSLEDLGALYRVHRATVSRWLVSARQALLEKTRDEIARVAGLGRLEVDSVMRAVVSRLDLSAGMFLERSRP